MVSGNEVSVKHVYAKDAVEWREWLRVNHKREDKVFLVYYKKATGKLSIGRRDAMMEAICFGWIDTVVKRLDDERYGPYFVKRKKTANWSTNTLAYAKELIKQKKMFKQGLEAYELGKKKKPFDSKKG